MPLYLSPMKDFQDRLIKSNFPHTKKMSFLIHIEIFLTKMFSRFQVAQINGYFDNLL